jgi:serine/threonine protein kinase
VAGYGSADSSPWAVGSVVLGEYLVEEHLGQGAFGRVDLVRSRRSGERYAAKRIMAGDLASQGRFLTEAQRWIGLPAHAHINACHFVRTAEDQLVVFSNYVPGGSLADSIGSGRLYQPDGAPVLSRLIDVAVQIAWGLDAAHSMGLLHLDMKPANVLVTEDLTASVTDFGLASGQEREPGEVGAQELVLDMLVKGVPDDLADVFKGAIRKRLVLGDGADDTASPQSRAEGGSSLYASPEQAEGRRLGGDADLWSWAVTVLEMFAGEHTWISGTVADEVLAQLVTEPDEARVPIPAGVAELLGACFRADPAERPSLGAVTDQLAATHAVRRSQPPRPSLVQESLGTHERTLVSGARWNDPQAWLAFAREAGVLDEEQMIRLWPSRLGSRRSQALEDLSALGEADRALASLAAPSAQQRLASAMIHVDMGHVHLSLGDLPGAIQDYQQGIQISAPVDDDQARLSTAETLNQLAIALRQQGRTDDAVAACDRALAICSSLGQAADVGSLTGAIQLTRANAWPDLAGKLPLYDQAIAALGQAGRDEGTVKALSGKAATLQSLGRQDEADQVWARADRQLDKLSHVVQVKRPGLLSAQARAKYSRALAARGAGDRLRFGEAAIAILQPLVEDLGWYELTGDLGQAVFISGNAREQQGQTQAALDAYRTARRLFEEAVIRDGRLDFTADLARSSDYEATLAGSAEDPKAGAALAEHAIELWQRLVAQDGLEVWAPQLASAQVKLGRALSEAGDLAHALERFDQALRVMTEAQPGPAWSFLIAQAHLGRGYILRRARRTDEAVSEYLTGFDALKDMAGEENAVARAEVLLSLSNVYGDAGRIAEAVGLLRASIADLESFIEPDGFWPSARIRARLADAYQRCANKLTTIAEYAQAREAAVRGLALYQELSSDGRRDQALQAARLQGAYGLILAQLDDVDGAIAGLTASRDALVRLGPGTTALRDLIGPAAPAATLDALVNEVDSSLNDLRRRRDTTG